MGGGGEVEEQPQLPSQEFIGGTGRCKGSLFSTLLRGATAERLLLVSSEEFILLERGEMLMVMS